MMLINAGVSPATAAPVHAVDGATIRIAPNGADIEGCGTDSQPCKTIQYALNQSMSGDTLKVATGTYTFNSLTNPCTFLITPAVTCVYNKKVTIIGGYSSSNWDIYAPGQNPTIIDGQSQYRGVALIAATNNQAGLTMKGFTVQNGRAYGKDNSSDEYVRHAFGAGIYASHGLLALEDMIVKNNGSYGGSSTSISIGGWAFGGGVAVEGPIYGGGTTSLQRVTLEGNQAVGGTGKNGGGNGIGGGLMTNDTALFVANLVVNNNTARGGNTAGNGCNGSGSGYGGAASLGNHSNIVLNQFTAIGNQVYGGSANGSLSCGGHGIGAGLFLEGATVLINDTLLKQNQSLGGTGKTGGIGWAGGIYSDKVNLTLDKVKIIANKAQSGGSSGSGQAGQAGGAGAYMAAFDGKDYSVSVTNCLVTDNEAIMGSPGTKNTGGGGGFFVQALPVDINHTTFSNNQLKNGLDAGQAIIVVALNGTSGKPGRVNIKYSLFTDHLNNYTSSNAALYVLPGSTASLSYNWFGRNTADYIVPSGTPIDHIWKDEKSGSYVSPSYPNFDYHLKADSPVINLASGSTLPIDIESQSRPVFNISDLGAYEFSVPALIVDRSSFFVPAGDNQIITLIIHVSATTGTPVDWTANTDAGWVRLSSSPPTNQASGETEDDLIVQLISSLAKMGSNSAMITITSSTADPVTISIDLLKMENIQTVYVPIIVRQ